jgi:hypothetical protein
MLSEGPVDRLQTHEDSHDRENGHAHPRAHDRAELNEYAKQPFLYLLLIRSVPSKKTEISHRFDRPEFRSIAIEGQQPLLFLFAESIAE